MYWEFQSTIYFWFWNSGFVTISCFWRSILRRLGPGHCWHSWWKLFQKGQGADRKWRCKFLRRVLLICLFTFLHLFGVSLRCLGVVSRNRKHTIIFLSAFVLHVRCVKTVAENLGAIESSWCHEGFGFLQSEWQLVSSSIMPWHRGHWHFCWEATLSFGAWGTLLSNVAWAYAFATNLLGRHSAGVWLIAGVSGLMIWWAAWTWRETRKDREFHRKIIRYILNPCWIHDVTWGVRKTMTFWKPCGHNSIHWAFSKMKRQNAEDSVESLRREFPRFLPNSPARCLGVSQLKQVPEGRQATWKPRVLRRISGEWNTRHELKHFDKNVQIIKSPPGFEASQWSTNHRAGK